jgi:hypothetical protein
MKFMTFSTLLLALSYTFSMCTSGPESMAPPPATNQDYPHVELSKDLVRAARNQADYAAIKERLAQVSPEVLAKELNNDQAKKAFWINVYNGFVQHILTDQPELFEDRGDFFGEPRVTIAGKELSFDDIEHGIIRGSRVKWLLGLIKDPFAGKYERTFRVDKTDGRIHFALNCGAKSCPYVAVYDARFMDEQLDEIARQFLNRTSTYAPDEEKVYVTSLFSWFRGDFGGKSGIRKDFLKKYDVIPEDADPSLEFDKYDWTLELGNFVDLETGPKVTR